MASTMDYENENGTKYEDEAPRYEQPSRDRSASPRPTRRESPRGGARRSASPNGNGAERGPRTDRGAPAGDDGAINPGSNLFVTGIHPRLNEAEVTRLFEKYGDVEKCQIMLDPHTKESRGFGFVKMVTAEQADAAKEGLAGEVIEGRTLSIEKARRSRPRTPTPGKYFGPPKRDDPRQGGSRGFDRYDDRRRGGGGYGGRDGYRSGRDYDDRDRGYRGGRDRYDDGPRIDRYGGGGRDDRSYDRRGGGGGYQGGRDYDRGGDRGGDRDGGRRDGPPPAQYGDPAPKFEAREPYGGRFTDDRGISRRNY